MRDVCGGGVVGGVGDGDGVGVFKWFIINVVVVFALFSWVVAWTDESGTGFVIAEVASGVVAVVAGADVEEAAAEAVLVAAPGGGGLQGVGRVEKHGRGNNGVHGSGCHSARNGGGSCE